MTHAHLMCQTCLDAKAEIERQREHIRRQAEDIIVLGREAGKAADKALIASNDYLRVVIERLRAALQFYATAVVATPAPDSPGHCDDGGYARRALETKP